MRVTENTNFDVIRGTINRTKEKMDNLQYQSSTLKKLNTPSDNPIGASKVLEMRTDKVNNDTFQYNAKMAESFLNNSDQALNEMSDLLARCKEIAINQSSGASSSDESRLGVAEEITQLYNQAVSIANRRVGDRYLFGGYKTQKPPIDDDGRFKGDDGQMMVEVAKDVFLSMNVSGIDAFNTQPTRSNDKRRQEGYDAQHQQAASPPPQRGPASEIVPNDAAGPENVNAFDEIQNLRIGLLTGDLDSIRNTLERFDSIYGKVVSTRAKIGSRLQGLQNTAHSIERHNLVNAQLTSQIEDADMAQVVSDMAKEETVFRSALASSHKLVQPTLLDFLK